MATKTASRRILTESVYPSESDSRRTVWRNAGECAHRWAANRHYYGRAGNVYFDRGVIFSYGRHFPMARHVIGRGEAFILCTTRTYSVSTSGHLADVRRAIPGGVEVYNVHDVTADRYAEHLANFRQLEKEAAALAAKASRARTRAKYLHAESLGTIRHANKYAAAVGLRERLAEPSEAELSEWARQCADAERKRTDAQRKAEAAAERKRRAKLAGEVAEWEQKLNAWRDGGEFPGYCPDTSHPLAGVAFLRVRGQRIETSLRAVVPLAAVLPVLDMVRRRVEYDRDTDPATDGPDGDGAVSIDGFELRRIDNSRKLVMIGCHCVSFDEIERAAKAAGL